MNIKKIISLVLMLLFGISMQKGFAQQVPQLFAKDSMAPANLANADSVIEEVAKSNTIPKQKVQYISEVTKYGFKNLFSNYNYNHDLSYNVQVNPNAEQFIQDYMKMHDAY